MAERLKAPVLKYFGSPTHLKTIHILIKPLLTFYNSAFTNKYLDHLDYEDLNELIKLLEIDDNNLYNFYNGLDTNIEFEDNKINNLFKNFKY